MMNPEHKKPAWLEELFLRVIETFNDSTDVGLLLDEKAENGKSHGCVGERAIAHRLAVHLEREFQAIGYPNDGAKIAVDCEYNRHRGAIKEFLVKDKLRERVEAAKGRVLREHSEKKGWYAFSIYPDIVVHQRGDDECNLIVIELKRASNTIDDELDALKLELFTTQDYLHGYGYVFGANVIAYDEDKFGKRRLEPSKLFVDPKLRA